MVKKISSIVCLLLLMIISNNSFSQSGNVKEDDVVGIWLNQEKDAKIQIYRDGDIFNGKLLWGDKNGHRASDSKDKNNPNSKLRDRILKGIVLLKNFKFKDNTWSGGTIYDPKNGKTYKCVIKKDSDVKLEIRGYVGFSWLGKTTYWMRVEE
ncbi:MAG: DUF2147 domain-containing protein [Bacteroidales bacterium]